MNIPEIVNEWLQVYTIFAGFAGMVLIGLFVAVFMQLAAIVLGRKADVVSARFYYRNRLCDVQYNDRTGEIISIADARNGDPLPHNGLRVDLSGNAPTLTDNDHQR